MVTQEGNQLIVEKCENEHDAEEEAAMVAEPVRRYAEPIGRCGRICGSKRTACRP